MPVVDESKTLGERLGLIKPEDEFKRTGSYRLSTAPSTLITTLLEPFTKYL